MIVLSSWFNIDYLILLSFTGFKGIFTQKAASLLCLGTRDEDDCD